jgi:hypothetical protein
VRRRLALAALGAALTALTGCGGDDEPQRADTASEPPPARTEKTQTGERTGSEPSGAPKGGPGKSPGSSPEDQPGGAGDEEPARVQALFTGRGGRITPRLVRVPPFIAVRLALRSADSRDYGLRFGGRGVVRTGRRSITVSTTLEGLRPGVSIVGVPVGAGGRVRIVADAEPGP